MPHAEIVGSGFGGLVAAIGLAERGWSVRISERRPALREAGYGIAIQQNMIRIFQALGIERQVIAGGMAIDRRDSLDGHGRLLLSLRNGLGRYRISRHHIIGCLAERARAAGVETAFEASVVAVDPAGALTFADGTRRTADLVVVASGISSALPGELGLLDRVVPQREGGLRLTIPRTAEDRARDARGGAVLVEAWADRRRVLFCPNSEDEIYVIFTCDFDDTQGARLPIDRDAWLHSFPGLAGIIDRTLAGADWNDGRWARFETLRLRRWSAGKVAVLGDAAHAMPPYLGQGAGHAMMNALGLAVALDAGSGVMPDVAAALQAWEARERTLTEHTQRWTRIYGGILHVPNGLKPAAIRAERTVPWIARQYARTANHVPTGCAPEPGDAAGDATR
jgi:2-polyprenyl-6-methoxyphenol hydroxylase-like FAD-dependent oxidoreductase